MEQINVMLEPVRAFLIQTGAFLPRLAIALLVLVAGFLVAKAVRFLIEDAPFITGQTIAVDGGRSINL